MRKIVVIFTIFLLIFIFTFIFYYFRLKKLIVVSKRHDLKSLSLLNNKNLLFLDLSSVKQQIKAKNKSVKDLILEKKHPDTLLMIVSFKGPLAFIRKNSKYLFVDKDGSFISTENQINSQNLVEIEIIGQNLIEADWRIVKALKYVDLFNKSLITPKKITIDMENFIYKMYSNEGLELFVKLSDNPDLISASLQTISSRFRIEGKFISKIDFQFDKPLVILKNE